MRFLRRSLHMSYRIEYLTETTDEDSVVHAFQSEGDTLDAAAADAVAHAEEAIAKGAHGFQIRHLNAVDRVVAIADFANADVNEL